MVETAFNLTFTQLQLHFLVGFTCKIVLEKIAGISKVEGIDAVVSIAATLTGSFDREMS